MKFYRAVKTFACAPASLGTKPPNVLRKLDDSLATNIISSLALLYYLVILSKLIGGDLFVSF